MTRLSRVICVILSVYVAFSLAVPRINFFVGEHSLVHDGVIQPGFTSFSSAETVAGIRDFEVNITFWIDEATLWNYELALLVPDGSPEDHLTLPGNGTAPNSPSVHNMRFDCSHIATRNYISVLFVSNTIDPGESYFLAFFWGKECRLPGANCLYYAWLTFAFRKSLRRKSFFRETLFPYLTAS
jgi:hypothetical protein